MKKKLTRLFKAVNNKVSNAVGKFLMWAMGEQIKDGIYLMRHKIVDHYTLMSLLREDEFFADCITKSEDFAKGVVERLNANDIRNYIDHKELSYHIDDRELASYIKAEDVAEHIDPDDVARYVDVYDYISDNLDSEEVAGYVDTIEVASSLDLESLSNSVCKSETLIESIKLEVKEFLENSTFTVTSGR